MHRDCGDRNSGASRTGNKPLDALPRRSTARRPRKISLLDFPTGGGCQGRAKAAAEKKAQAAKEAAAAKREAAALKASAGQGHSEEAEGGGRRGEGVTCVEIDSKA